MPNIPRKDDPFMTHYTKPDGLHTVPPLIATGPLGLCYHCVGEAITLAPTVVPISDQYGNQIGVQVIALPHCQACMTGTSGTGSRLIT
jgi:hypothetical protein